ncbi:MAG: nuclear transport factor 2 family protein [Hyphomonadaceae bacterium]|nr:nuclear transport factor 2 family protein [Hyphomonadaceae bacterium]
MLRQVTFIAAVITLGACANMGEFASAQTSSTATTAAPAPTTYRQPPAQQLLELERQLSARAQEQGLGAALGSVIDPADGFVVRAGQTYQGAEAVTAGLVAPTGAGPIYWQPDRVFVAQAGDMGLTSGRYVQVMTGAEAVQGRYTAVWRRDSNGDWKLLSESRLADPPRRR